MNYSITFTSSQFNILKDHLYPGDNKEAIAFALCGRRAGLDRYRLLVQEIILVPYELCSRTAIQLKWSTALLPKILENAVNHNLSLLKIHSHPNDVNNFSATDDISDQTLFKSVYGWTGEDNRHASAILFENNQFIGRIIYPDGRFQAVSTFQIVGDDVIIQNTDNCLRAIRPAGKRVAQTFGTGTYDKLEKMKIAVVGCSGTGGPVVEMLARNCVGELVLVDPDIVEEKNLNRIPNAFLTDAQNKEFKVTVLKKAVLRMGTGTNVLAIPKTIFSSEAILAVAECDYIFGCMDGIEGRHILNRLATFYSIPYSDLGVKLLADGKGGIMDICG
ncbi:MAG: ThiF family adenylyltransferase, partial [Desulfobacteraceae bacterium]|nr:ThiF family adenylyltransferase [Desulfobacteraceae bacterium]